MNHDHSTQAVIYEIGFKLSHVDWNIILQASFLIFADIDLFSYWMFRELDLSNGEQNWRLGRMVLSVDGFEISALYVRLDVVYESFNFFRCNYSCLNAFLKKSSRLEYLQVVPHPINEIQIQLATI